MSTRAWFASAIVVLVLIGIALFLLSHAGHRRPPHPRGMVVRFEARAARHPRDCMQVTSAVAGGPSILVASSDGDGMTHVVEYRFPSGERIVERRTVAAPLDPGRGFLGTFDMDGDAVADRIEMPSGYGQGYGTVRVVSGHDGRVLFDHRDPLEYECSDRAFALPDLDGDGCSELALVHPRQDRSRYDLEIWDRILGAKSWITIVSGREATR